MIPGTVIEVTTRSFPEIGGVENHVHQLSRHLTRKGLRMFVFSHTHSLRHGDKSEQQIIDGVNYTRFPLPWRRNWSVPSIGLLKRLRKDARNADVVHLHLYHQPLALFAALSLTGIDTPIVFTPHYHGTGHSPLARLLHHVWRPTAGRFLMSVSAQVIAVSQPEADLLVKHFPFLAGRISVIPNGISSLEEATPAPVKGSTRVFLSVGRLESYKRNDLVVRAAAQLGEESLFVLVGDGPERTRLEDLARLLGVEHRMLFLGRVDDASLASWWARADVFVSMSEQEAFGLALGEALSAGVSAIVSDIPAFRYIASLARRQGAVSNAITFACEQDLVEALAEAPGRIPPVHVSRWDETADRTIEIFQLTK